MDERLKRILNKHKPLGAETKNHIENDAKNAVNIAPQNNYPKNNVTGDSGIDPRTDLKADHQLWVDLLTNTQAMFPEIFPTLHGLRCSGTRLAKTTNGFKLLPGENRADEWQRVRTKYLDPIRDKLIKLFEISHIGTVVDGKPPEQFTLRDAWTAGAGRQV